ncbi:MAG: type II secretion system F family protein [Rickettsiales bacterium]
MAQLLSSFELWVGLGLLLLVVWLATRKGTSKKTKLRLARVTQKSRVTASASIQSLRKHDPNQDSAIGQALSSMRSISKLKARLEVAGMSILPHQFLAVMGGIAFATIFVLVGVMHKSLVVALPFALLLGLGLPHMAVSRKIKKRQLAFLKLFPEAIELMVRGLRAGLPIAESFQVVSRELPPPMGDTFAAISQQTTLGVPMEKALSDAAKKMNLTEFNFFVTTVILQRETGGNLGEILFNLADMLRGRQMMKLKIGALSSEARASAYIVGSLPFVVFLLLQAVSPQYLRPLFNDFRGNIALAGACVSMFTGGFIMKQMTKLEI